MMRWASWLLWRIRVSAFRFGYRRDVLRTDSRLYFEFEVLRGLAALRPTKLLFVGVDRHTHWYPSLFRPGVVQTIDIDPEVQPYGSRYGHTTACCSTLPAIWPSEYFDAVVFNGVYGWGVDSPELLDACLEAIRIVLRPDGLLVFGYNQPLDPADLRANGSRIFRDFRRVPYRGVYERVLENYMQHTFIFFRPSSGSAGRPRSEGGQ